MSYDPNQDLPATDADLLQLYDDTKAWLIARGMCSMPGDLYGLSLTSEEETRISDRFMYGSDPVSYRADVSAKTLRRISSLPGSLLDMSKLGLDIHHGLALSYEEPFHRVLPTEVGEIEIEPEDGCVYFHGLGLKGLAKCLYIAISHSRVVDSGFFEGFFVDGEYDSEPADQEIEMRMQQCNVLTGVIGGLTLLAATGSKRIYNRLKW